MIDFSLWRADALPSSVEIDGAVYTFRPGFRTVLKIFSMLNDPDVMVIEKGARLVKWFFEGAPGDQWEVVFGWFVRCGDQRAISLGEAVFDYDFDAPDVYASFMQLYRIDLFKADMHWWEFSALLSGCFRVASPLSEKIRIRTMDVSKCENKAAAQRAKDAVAIPSSIGQDDRILSAKVYERLQKGESIKDLIGG